MELRGCGTEGYPIKTNQKNLCRFYGLFDKSISRDTSRKIKVVSLEFRPRPLSGQNVKGAAFLSRLSGFTVIRFGKNYEQMQKKH